MFRVLAFGDSLTAGYQLRPEAAFSKLLESKLRDHGFDAIVTNAGVSGDTTKTALDRVNWSLKAGPFDVVLVELGANDGLRRLPVGEMEKNLSQIVQQFQAKGSLVALLGIKLPLNYDAKYRHDFEAVYPRVSKKYKAPLMPFILDGVATVDGLNLEDAMHPNEAGHKVIAEKLWLFLEKNALLPRVKSRF